MRKTLVRNTKAVTTVESAIIVLLLIAIILSSSTLYYMSSQLATVSESVEETSGKMEEMLSTTADLATAEVALAESLADVTETVGGLATTLAGLATTLAGLGVEVAGYAETIAALEDTIADLEDTTGALKDRIAAIEEAIKPPPTKPTGPLIVAQGTETSTLDAHGVHSTPEAIITEHIYDGLVTIDQVGKIIPRLATRWEVTSDGLRWTFYLRDDAVFQDGTPFNAEAVKDNVERLINPDIDVPLRTYVSMMDHAEVVDDYTVTIVLKYPHAPFLARMSASCSLLVSPTAAEKGQAYLAEHPSGTGPYKLVEWIKGERLILERFDDYWGERPYYDEIIFRVVPEDATRLMMLEAGDVDIIVRPPVADIPRIEANPDFVVIKKPSTRTIYVAMNTQWGPLKNKKVRQAFNYAIDEEAIVGAILKGLGSVMDSPAIPAMFGYKSVGAYQYDPDKARELLAEAGYPNGFSVTLMAPKGRYLMDYETTQAIQSYLIDVGIDCKLGTMEWVTYINWVRKPIEETEIQMAMLGWGSWILDADQQLYPMFHSSQWPPYFNIAFYSNDRVDELLDTGTSTVVESERISAYGEAQDIIMDECPWVFLHNTRFVVVYKAGLTGVKVYPIEQFRVMSAKPLTP